MSSENQRRHNEVQARLEDTIDVQPSSQMRSYWNGFRSNDLEREHAREEAAIETRLARMKTRPAFAALQA